ncbi:MAG: single-stranded DNA-binding protein [Candidatus Latescibacterota bacterium]
MTQLRMPAINQVALSGRLVQDPDFRVLDNGSARLSARIAVNRAYRDRNDAWQEETSFFSIVLWQRSAEIFHDRLHKGTPVFVTGRLRSSTWRDEEDNPHSRVEIQVRNLQLLERDGARNGEPAEEEGAEDETEMAAS